MITDTAYFRIVDENKELEEKITYLEIYNNTSFFESLRHEEKQLLKEQLKVMKTYNKILLRRIEIWEPML